ncbi:histidine triad (HIT) family protein [Nocardiopsis arvandica]|uniref:Histidine triad (HIT) family protein n=1 Tax=Nocardiopsis sinuspersici TaxID=501010 RepID=A0A7Y9XGB0_9ACTN|nr:HIT family protein [Nocardiopsis sinuspersici]NYH55281.1 histidine triad (HIT) family protein [Nocardiopsis sinuspersici]
MDECLFCAIRDGEAERSLVYSDDLVLAFMDLYPVTPGHVLVVPREHLVGLSGVDDALGGRLWGVARRVGDALRADTAGGASAGPARESLRCEGVNLFLADGEAAGQEVLHVHLHVFPRFEGDSFSVQAVWEEADRGELDGHAAVLRALLA